jgi:hypothetical protein
VKQLLLLIKTLTLLEISFAFKILLPGRLTAGYSKRRYLSIIKLEERVDFLP